VCESFSAAVAESLAQRQLYYFTNDQFIHDVEMEKAAFPQYGKELQGEDC